MPRFRTLCVECGEEIEEGDAYCVSCEWENEGRRRSQPYRHTEYRFRDAPIVTTTVTSAGTGDGNAIYFINRGIGGSWLVNGITEPNSSAQPAVQEPEVSSVTERSVDDTPTRLDVHVYGQQALENDGTYRSEYFSLPREVNYWDSPSRPANMLDENSPINPQHVVLGNRQMMEAYNSLLEADRRYSAADLARGVTFSAGWEEL
jgi:hypothetical protein